jgi:hypothetical protein
VFFINLSISKLMHDTVYLVITYWERVKNYLGTNEGSILSVHWSDGISIFRIFVWKKASLQMWVDPKNAVKQEFFIVLRRQINFDRDQRATAIDKTAARDRLVGRDWLTGHLCSNAYGSWSASGRLYSGSE